ncbi:efflux RND transporter periplasmic adaptor subunit [Pseudoduganella violacea]|uniref:RND family efflux transporter MFP subunit n=1 Tax=Pseudoduganella violacea TaxID=1715466 RepID=A0A7W5FUQ6_9BURK|nr:efflux RND transporter periplasmic adaptor subunit [Pseudoduganella violacea]MBB3119992.1 RND family efflux transporter MFP subunit [Pseudoduganella violacea]
MPHPLSLTAMAAAAVLLAACSKPAEKTEDIRPVRAIVLQSSDVDVNAEFSGEVRPRVESRLGFRVGGKIISRKVDVGTPVKRGQVLMQLDPQDLRLAQTQAMASLRAAETNRDFALAELKRYQELREKNFVSQAILDSKSSAYKAAEATVDSSKAVLAGQANQTGYSTLEADIDGVVTAVDAEVGQVVAPGTPVVRVAKSGEKEIVIGVPEDKVDVLRKIEDVQVRLWANPNEAAPGKIREVSPVADPATRTYTFKVTIPPSMADAKLGMTASVQFASKTPAPQIKVPLTALFHEKSATSVWVVENGAVKLVPVTVGGAAGNELVLNSGVKAGQQVVTAGVHLLKPGQKVKVLDAEPAQQKAQPQPQPNTKAVAGASK